MVPTAPIPALTEDQVDDLFFAARAGDLEDVAALLDPVLASSPDHIPQLLMSLKNDSDNTLLHYCSANGHREMVNYLLPHSTLPYLLHQNASGNTALHWAGLNGHLAVVTLLINRIEACERANPQQASKLNLLLHVQPSGDEKQEQGSERRLWDVRNKAGRGPMSEAQMNQRDDVVKFLLERMIGGQGEGAPATSSQQVEDKQQGQNYDQDEGLELQAEKLSVNDA